MSGTTRVVRQGVQALFSFTPFKLLRASEEGYVLLLAPTSSMDVSPSFEWRSASLKSFFRVPITERYNKRVVLPHQLKSQRLDREGHRSYFYRVPSNKLKALAAKGDWGFPPVLMEFSYSALTQAHYCQLGWVVSSSHASCPLKSECPYFQAIKKTGECVHYKGPSAYSSLYNVSPKMQRRFVDPVASFQFEPVIAIRYADNPLAIARFTEDGNFTAYVDGVIFYPKPKWITAQPSVFLKEGIGFRLSNIHAIEFEFPKEVLDKYVKDRLTGDPLVLRWISAKFLLYMNTMDEDTRIKEKGGLKAFKKLEKLVGQAVSEVKDDKLSKLPSEISQRGIDDDLLNFAEVLLLHSFAHVLKNSLTAEFGIRSEDLAYAIEHPNIKTTSPALGKVRVLVFEPVEGGYGYLRAYASRLQSGENQSLVEVFESQGRLLRENCEEKSLANLHRVSRELDQFKDQYEELVSAIQRAYALTFDTEGLYPHINAIRRAIGDLYTVPDNVRPLLDDFLERGPHCWDGCQLCIMLERECNFLPFDQPFLVSEHLVRFLLEDMGTTLREPTVFHPLSKGIMEQFSHMTSLASRSIDVVSPWISPDIIGGLVRLHSTRQIRVRVITKEDPSNETQIASLRDLMEAQSKYAPMVQYRLSSEPLHAKGMIVDGIMALHGSFNFTQAGLKSNVENATVDYSTTGAKKFSLEFDRLWSKSSAPDKS